VFFSVDVEAAVQLAVAATLNTQRAASGSEGLWENTRQNYSLSIVGSWKRNTVTKRFILNIVSDLY